MQLIGVDCVLFFVDAIHLVDYETTDLNKCITSSGASLLKASGKSRSMEHFLEQLWGVRNNQWDGFHGQRHYVSRFR